MTINLWEKSSRDHMFTLQLKNLLTNNYMISVNKQGGPDWSKQNHQTMLANCPLLDNCLGLSDVQHFLICLHLDQTWPQGCLNQSTALLPLLRLHGPTHMPNFITNCLLSSPVISHCLMTQCGKSSAITYRNKHVWKMSSLKLSSEI